MAIRAAILAGAAMLSSCFADETVAGYGATGKTWALTEIDDRQITARATLRFPERGRIAGKAPCNAWSAELIAPYPWFEIGPVAATRRACPDLAAETAFFEALAAMTLAEVLGDVLILSTPEGRRMVFTAAD